MAWRDSYEVFTVAQAKQGTYVSGRTKQKRRKQVWEYNHIMHLCKNLYTGEYVYK